MSTPPHPPIGEPSSSAVADLLRQAIAQLSRDQVEPAERLLGQALRLAPGDARVLRLAGIAAVMAGEYPAAVEHLRGALVDRPDDASIHLALGRALVALDARDDGLQHLRRACALAPANATVWYSVGVAFQSIASLQDARSAFEHTLELEPELVAARNALAHVQMSLGDTSAAATMLRDTLRMQPDCVDAWIALGNLKTERLGNNDVEQLRAALARPGQPDDARIGLGFTLARALEDQADYAAAFDALRVANGLRRRQLTWNREAERARVDAIARAFDRPLPAPSDSAFGHEVIFVVSTPRAASTLTEQILASHSAVEGGDELLILPEILNAESERRGQPFPAWVRAADRADWRRLGEEYLARARARLGDRRPHFTDKTVDNWAFAGAALAMLPGAHVVNSRRDALETCFACYRQWFPNGCEFTYDLDDMVAYYAGYARLCGLWRQQFPRRWFDHDHEALQRDMEGEIRRLLAFCGLPVDPACLAFYRTQRPIRTFSGSQVRQPLRRDTARAPLYGPLLDPLRAKLHAAGVLRTGTRSSP